MRRTPLRAAAVTVGGLALAVGPLVAPASAATHEIQLLGINDFHGRLEATVDDNGTPADPSDDITTGGAKQMAGAVGELSDGFGGDTYFVSAGDNIGASTFTSNVQEDEPTIAALNAMGLVTSAVGNHEFDKGYDDIAIGGRVDSLADFPYLGANVYAEGTPDVALLQEYELVTTTGGVTIGFVGTVTDETASLVIPAGIEGIEFGDEADAANRVADELTTSGEADVVVVLSHSGSSAPPGTDPPPDCATVVADNELVAGSSADIDAIIQGHTHTAYACDAPAAPYLGGFAGPVVQSGQYGENLSQITLTYEDGDGGGTPGVTASNAEVLPIEGYPSDNAEVNQIVDAAVAFAAEAGSVPLGAITTDILTGANGARDVESVLGNFIADVQLTQTRDAAGAQIALMNPGGIRTDFLINDQFGDEACGVVTLGEANAVQPFANAVVTKTYTGAEIKLALEQQWQPAGSERPFLALGVSEGFFFEYDSSLPEGTRITSITLDGEDVLPASTYRVTINEFLATGGDNFGALGGGTDAQQLGQSDLEALTDYLGVNSPVTPDEEPRRSADGGGPAAALNASGATCPATPPPGGGGGGGDDDDDQNPGLSVDTGVTSSDNQLWAVSGLLLVLAAGGAVAFRRRGAVR